MNLLNKISNEQLELQLKDLVSRERKLLHVILEHIKEVEIRRIHLAKAYPSMYEYLTKELGYSGSAAMRRLEASRLLRDVPVIAEKIKDGSVNLSQICELSKLVKEKERVQGERIKPDVKTDLVEMISGKTLAETQKELSQALDIELKEHEKAKTQKDESVRLEITLSKEQFELLQKCKELSAHTISQRNMEFNWASVLEVIAEKYVKGFDPKSPRKLKHNTFSESCTVSFANKASIPPTRDNSVAMETTTASVAECVTDTSGDVFGIGDSLSRKSLNNREANKRIPSKAKKLTLARDYTCQYQTSSGKKCNSKFQLEVDHKQALWAGGTHSPENLQALCAAHNKYKYSLEGRVRLVSE